HELPVSVNNYFRAVSENNSKHEPENWLDTSHQQDVVETINVIQEIHPDWLIVDHYSLGQIWETKLRPYVRKIMVIDDLANRQHDCDLLLDQNYVKDGTMRYEGLVPQSCTKLLGLQHVLLRSEFTDYKKQLPPKSCNVQRIFLFFGGSDPGNLTCRALEALSDPGLIFLNVDVVIGESNRNRGRVEKLASKRKNTQLYIQIDNIAQLMGAADLALGAGGSTTWERLFLGLPSITIINAVNQKQVTEDLEQIGAIWNLGWHEEVSTNLIARKIFLAINSPETLKSLSKTSFSLLGNCNQDWIKHNFFH
ncbi:MAG: UDP-2,4-diacetamido-2,4,6-trideoxy-beta-L-altropyranose hydrolase, partial [Methylococcales bacterium]|nr:UDP-2,4-diacetamido-2,4,6-trideoxy-beta-L-altropyranose hydrolase [Methylococcales bacterium]